MNWEEGLGLLETRLHAIGSDGKLLVLWAVASSLVAVMAVALTWQAATHMLEHELRATAANWADHLVDTVADLDAVMKTGSISPRSMQGLRAAGSLGGVLRYRLFGDDGRSIYASDERDHRAEFSAPGDTAHDRPSLRRVLAADRAIVTLEEDAGSSDLPAVYGRIYLPVVTGQGVRGVAEIEIDQTDKAAHYRREFVVFATGLSLLILFAMALPMAMVWRKTKQRELAERRLHDMAHRDPLTRLANRTDFRERLARALDGIGREDRVVALFWLDLDRFKTINDALGHPIGDTLLCQVATRLRRSLHEQDAVARLGGDEFAILLSNCTDRCQAAELARRLIDLLALPFNIDGHHVVIGVSIGIVFTHLDGDQVDDLLKKADIALYHAKDAGRSTYRFFQPDMEARSQVRHVLEEDLRRALDTSQIRLHYQPQVALDSGRIVGFEALLRWHHPRYGHMPPAEVIALAEETGLIVPLGFWALKRACTDASTWPDGIRVSVNISAVQFRHTNLVNVVGEALSMSSLPPDRLDLEITESIVMEDSKETLAKLRKLRRLGVHLSMDDFGTGYSSLSRLRHLPFDRLKVDRSFVRELAGNRDDIAIVHAIVTLGRSLGMQIIAEGVETDAQLAYLRLENCDIAQGFFFGRPVPASEIGRQLARYNRTCAVGLHAPRDKPTQTRRPPDRSAVPASAITIHVTAICRPPR